ncbi:MAG: AIR synthase family protein [Actinobacteria bacterium]|jgi:hydrogenase maturation factor|nr:AIR synthase family protein [Actinomycetota bacterium]
MEGYSHTEETDSRQLTGKVTPELFEKIIYRKLGAKDSDVLVGPRHGVDVGVVRVAEGRAMALTTDPVFVVPAYGWERAAWFAVHILASDAATSGLPLKWMTVDLNLPPEISDNDLSTLWEAFSNACSDIGISVVAGHTARYDGCNWPMVGGATCLAVGDESSYVTPAMAMPGHQVVITKGAAIEATALFAATFPDRLRQALGNQVQSSAESLFKQMSVVKEASIASSFGLRDQGVTSMHDATEGGVFGGLVELANASEVGIRIVKEAIPLRPEVDAVCSHIGIDPYTSISEGTLIATVVPSRAREFVSALADAGIESAIVGEILPRSEGMILESGGERIPLAHPGLDPFWDAFSNWATAEQES